MYRLFVHGPELRAGALARLGEPLVGGHGGEAALGPGERTAELRDAVVGVVVPGARQRGLGGAQRERGDVLLVGHALVRGRHAERSFEGDAGADIVAERLLRKAHDRPERRGLTRLPRQERRVSEPLERLLADRHHLLVLPVLVEREAPLDRQRINPERRARPGPAGGVGADAFATGVRGAIGAGGTRTESGSRAATCSACPA